MGKKKPKRKTNKYTDVNGSYTVAAVAYGEYTDKPIDILAQLHSGHYSLWGSRRRRRRGKMKGQRKGRKSIKP